MVELEHIAECSSFDSGGGIVLDLVHLKDGKLLVISEEAVVLYQSMEDFESGAAGEQQSIFL